MQVHIQARQETLESSQVDLRYLKGATDHGIMFIMEQSIPSVMGYVDSDYVGDLDDMRSTTWYIFTLVGGPIC